LVRPLEKRPGRPDGALVALKKSALRETDNRVLRDDHVVEHSDVDQRKRLFERRGQQFVRPRRLGDSARMIVREDHRRAVMRQCLFHDLARIDRRLGERAGETTPRLRSSGSANPIMLSSTLLD